MTERTARFAAFAAVGLLLAAFVGPGDPVPGTSVGLDHDPGGLVATRVTDDLGRVEFAVGEGRYAVFLINPSAPAIVTVTPVNDAPMMVSAPIMPGRGRVYALDAAGRRLFVRKAGGGGGTEYLRLIVTEAGPGTGPHRWTPVIPRPREDLRIVSPEPPHLPGRRPAPNASPTNLSGPTPTPAIHIDERN